MTHLATAHRVALSCSTWGPNGACLTTKQEKHSQTALRSPGVALQLPDQEGQASAVTSRFKSNKARSFIREASSMKLHASSVSWRGRASPSSCADRIVYQRRAWSADSRTAACRARSQHPHPISVSSRCLSGRDLDKLATTHKTGRQPRRRLIEAARHPAAPVSSVILHFGEPD